MPIKNLFRIIVITCLLLLIPLTLQLAIGTGIDGQGFNWKTGDFIVVGALIFISGLGIDVVIRRRGKYRVLAVALIILAFLWLYAELAVGIFTYWGS